MNIINKIIQYGLYTHLEEEITEKLHTVYGLPKSELKNCIHSIINDFCFEKTNSSNHPNQTNPLTPEEFIERDFLLNYIQYIHSKNNNPSKNNNFVIKMNIYLLRQYYNLDKKYCQQLYKEYNKKKKYHYKKRKWTKKDIISQIQKRGYRIKYINQKKKDELLSILRNSKYNNPIKSNDNINNKNLPKDNHDEILCKLYKLIKKNYNFCNKEDYMMIKKEVQDVFASNKSIMKDNILKQYQYIEKNVIQPRILNQII